MLARNHLARVFEILPTRRVGRPTKQESGPKPEIGFWGPAYERDVEILFIEPLLNKLGYGKGTCLKRPHLNAFCGGENIELVPDYSFGTYQRVGMVLESKYRIHTMSEFKEAYDQVSNYGCLLDCSVVCTASLDGLWVFPRGDSSFDEFIHMSWTELLGDDGFREIAGVIGPAAILGSNA